MLRRSSGFAAAGGGWGGSCHPQSLALICRKFLFDARYFHQISVLNGRFSVGNPQWPLAFPTNTLKRWRCCGVAVLISTAANADETNAKKKKKPTTTEVFHCMTLDEKNGKDNRKDFENNSIRLSKKRLNSRRFRHCRGRQPSRLPSVVINALPVTNHADAIRLQFPAGLVPDPHSIGG